MKISEILTRFEDTKRNGAFGWMGKCPCHDDRTPSLSISESEDGKILLKCFAGCSTEDIVSKLGLEMSDLFPEKPQVNGASKHSSFNWTKCVAAMTEADMEWLAQWRGYSPEFVHHLHAQGIVGVHDGNIAFKNNGGCHVKLKNGKWKFEPRGQRTEPLVFGDARACGHVFVFESTWDALCFADKFGW